jgi:hypothetical protein
MTNLYFEELEMGTARPDPYTDGYRVAPLLPGKGQDLDEGELRLGFDLNQRGYAFRSQDAPQRKQLRVT